MAKRSWLAILAAGLTAAALDLAGALASELVRGGEPARVLPSIASGLMGRDAYAGATGALVGAALHLLIATTMAAAYGVVAMRWSLLVRRPWRIGPIYGIAMWAVMYLIVMPARWPRHFPRFDPADTTVQLAFHVALVGLPIALIVARGLRGPQVTAARATT